MTKPLLKRHQFLTILASVLVLIQIPIWFGTGSVFSLVYTYYTQYKIIQDNIHLQLVNNELIDKISALQNGTDEINARARLELGLIGPNESYYQVIQ